ncbi:unnamed protein product [Bursaphelenchus xylophilus]|uniref:(pine wood nematode) hypothetical protein n=1 Tax=Bursaphelenchus xylophilus TaxID=6326 RepID=A0A1I7RN52_BURXY|nr:unnamed protein product [Bursaphelenchus xylophilus]CAG9087709.1 unnamed protein product [Bursaphelenchus xylophilus]
MDNLLGYASSSSDESDSTPSKKQKLDSPAPSNSSTPLESRQDEPAPRYVEPEAPTRKSFSETPQNKSPSDEEEEAEENRLIAEGGALLAVTSTGGSNCPTPSRESEGENEEINEEITQLPPEPEGEVDPDVEANFHRFFKYKEQRKCDMNKLLTERKDFKNPSMYEKLKEQFDIDEYGSNFDKRKHEFIQFEDEDYYDALSETQAKITEKEQSRRKKV